MYRSPNMDTTDGAFCGFSKDFFSKLWYCDVSQHRCRIGFIYVYFVWGLWIGKIKLRNGKSRFCALPGAAPGRGSPLPNPRARTSPLHCPGTGLFHLEWGRAHCYYAVQKPSARKENCNNDSDYLFFLLYFLVEHCIWKYSLILKISSIFINLCPFLIGTTERLETKQKFKENFKTAYVFVFGLLQWFPLNNPASPLLESDSTLCVPAVWSLSQFHTTETGPHVLWYSFAVVSELNSSRYPATSAACTRTYTRTFALLFLLLLVTGIPATHVAVSGLGLCT